MTTSSFKVESGIQLLARLVRKPTNIFFYPKLFQSGLKPGEAIEIINCKDNPGCLLLTDLISTALLPKKFGGAEMGVLIFNCSNNLNYDTIINTMGKKIISYMNVLHKNEVDDIIEKQFVNLCVVDIHDATQYYTTIYNLENVLLEHPNITMVIFDTISAFYWSEQYFKIMKMDTYLKKVLSKILSFTKEHNVIVIYSKPDYFVSSKDVKDSLEACYEFSEGVNYRISFSYGRDNTYLINIRSYNMQLENRFCITNNQITWIKE